MKADRMRKQSLLTDSELDDSGTVDCYIRKRPQKFSGSKEIIKVIHYGKSENQN